MDKDNTRERFGTKRHLQKKCKEFGIKMRPRSRKKKQKMTTKTWKTLTYVVALLIHGCLENCRLQIC